jgi:hypothetical protein
MANLIQSVASRAREVIDRALLSLVRLRLTRSRTPGDAADRFGDGVIRLLGQEIERRNSKIEGFARERLRQQAAESDEMRRAAGFQAFEQFCESGDRLRQ